jgi:hypothetical protein
LSFGFAVFEGPDDLLDWGIKSFRNGVNAVKVPFNMKLGLLLDQCGPRLVVIKTPRATALKRVDRTLVALVRSRRIPVQQIPAPTVREVFSGHNQNKYEIATVIAARYPELSPRLGPRRKLWQPERYSMSIFDAVALGIAYFMCKATESQQLDLTHRHE